MAGVSRTGLVSRLNCVGAQSVNVAFMGRPDVATASPETPIKSHVTRLRTGLVLVVAALTALPCAVVAMPKAGAEFEAAARATPNLTHGAAMFETCAACHATSGVGASDGSVPAIAGQHFRVIVKQLVE